MTASTPLAKAPAFVGCQACEEYLQRRGHVIARHIVAAAKAQDVRPAVKALAFFAGVHERHASGKSLATPPSRRDHP